MMCQKIARFGWSGFGIHPTHFRSIMAIPPKSHPKEYREVYYKTAVILIFLIFVIISNSIILILIFIFSRWPE